MRLALAIVTAIFAASSLTGCAGGSATGPIGDRPSSDDVVYAVCTDVQTRKFQAQGQGDQSQATAHLLCQTASGGRRDNPSQEGCRTARRGGRSEREDDLGRSPLMLARSKGSVSVRLRGRGEPGLGELRSVPTTPGPPPRAA